LKPSLTAKQNDCVVYFSPMHTMKVPVHKIQSCSMFCYTESACYSCLIWIKLACVFCIFSFWQWWKHNTLKLLTHLQTVVVFGKGTSWNFRPNLHDSSFSTYL